MLGLYGVLIRTSLLDRLDGARVLRPGRTARAARGARSSACVSLGAADRAAARGAALTLELALARARPLPRTGQRPADPRLGDDGHQSRAGRCCRSGHPAMWHRVCNSLQLRCFRRFAPMIGPGRTVVTKQSKQRTTARSRPQSPASAGLDTSAANCVAHCKLRLQTARQIANWPGRQQPVAAQRSCVCESKLNPRSKVRGDEARSPGRIQVAAAPPEKVSDSLTNEVRCGDAEGSLSDRGCEGGDLGAASGGRERGRDRPPAGPAKAHGEQVSGEGGRDPAEVPSSIGALPDSRRA